MRKKITSDFITGFDKATERVYEVIHGLDWSKIYTAPEILELIEDEIEAYKKDA